MDLTHERDAWQDNVLTAGDARAVEALAPATPSDQVVVGAIPQAPGFQPLADLLRELEQSDTGVSVLTGMPGVGMTQLAAAYARAKAAAGWHVVAWVNAGETGSTLAGLAAVAEAVGLSSTPGRDAVGAGGAVRRWMEADGDRCLLVFDDAEDPDALRPFLPARGAARVLVTTSRQPAADLGNSIPVDVFSTDEAVEFLTGTTDLEEKEAAAVAAELGYLPLALAAAAAVIGCQPGYETYLERLRVPPAEAYVITEEGQLYPPGVAKSLVLSLDAVQESDQTGVCRGVMEIMAVLSPGGVRRELLHAAGQVGVLVSHGQPVATSLVDRALERLAEWSLLGFSLDGQTVMAHRLVTWVVRKRLDRRQLTAVCRAAAWVLEARAVALAGSGDRQAAREISQHATALLDSAPRPAAAVHDELTRILLRVRFLALYQLIELGGSAPQAIAVGESLTADLERLLGQDHPDTLNSRNSLAAAYLEAGRVFEAVPLFEQTLVARQRLLGPDHPDTLTSQNNLAAVYQDAGRVTEAILLFELTLAARERLLGSSHLSTVNSRGNLAAAYRDGGRVSEAVPLLKQTLALRQRLLGPDHGDTVRSRANLAAAYREMSHAANVGRDAKQVVVGHVPRQPQGFLSRADLLAQLNRVERGVSVLAGMPGAGTTQLAAAYARGKVAAGWRVVGWVSARNRDSLLAGLAGVADAAGLTDGGGHGAADAGPALRRWLETDGDRCLLVFDDAEDPDALRPFLPVQGAARVLITTSRGSMADLGTTSAVDVFSAEDAMALLNARTGLTDEARASALAADLGYLPLAVDHAAAVIAGQHLGYWEYLRWLRAMPVGDHLSGDQESYPPGVAPAILLSLEVARGADREGVGSELLEIVSVLSAAGVGRELLDVGQGAGTPAAGGGRAAAVMVDQALARLADQALLSFTVDGQTVIMHGLVARVIRDELTRRKRLTTVCRAAASILEARAEAVGRSPDRRAVRELAEQVTSLLDSAGKSDEQLTKSLLRLRVLVLDCRGPEDQELMDQVGGDFQDDRPELVRVVDLLEVEDAGGADRQDGRGGAHPVAQRGVGAGEQVDERLEPPAEAREPVLARLHGLHRGPVLLHEAEYLAADHHDPDVAVQDLALGSRSRPGPVN